MLDRKHQRELMDAWKEVPEGTPVTVKKDGGEEVKTKTRSEAWLLPSGMAVIMLEGIRGCYSLDRVMR